MITSSQEFRETLGFDSDNQFDSVSITLASPDAIMSWCLNKPEDKLSDKEVKSPETINYRTFKPEPGGLFCQKIFGPVRDYECACGKYKRIRHKDVVCDRCGVEVTVSRVRRERMGYISLAVPVTHIWFLKSMPSRLGLILDMTAKSLEKVIYYENYLVIDPGKTPMEQKTLLTEDEYNDAIEEFGEEAFTAKMGAEALYDVLASMDLEAIVYELDAQMHSTKSRQTKRKISKRLKLVKGFLHSGSRPEWMILKALPVIPPDLRPLVPLEGGRFATSDLNDLYRRVINRNNRLKNLMQLKTPDVIIHNEKRMLQEAVDALFDNGRRGRAVTGPGNRPLKSLSDMLKGKQGRFRQNLLGKRVDYSGRSVIVIGPDLKLNQCGLPKKMALVLFEPFIIRRLKELGFVHTVRSARKMIEKKSPEVWDILEEVTKGHPVMLNRAPTLHRLSIQAFEPVLIEGDAIRLHPLVCTAFNADFDGDQMAVHVPLSLEAIMECKLMLLATNNIFSPSSGKPIMTPSQDIVLGTYYITYEPSLPLEKGKKAPLFSTQNEVEYANASGELHWHDWIDYINPNYGEKTIYGNSNKKVIRTTVGRVIFNQIWPKQLGFVNFAVGKGKLGDLILNTVKVDKAQSVKSLDRLKKLGFRIATRAGISIGVGDMIVPEEKKQSISKAQSEIDKIENQYKQGIITQGERYDKVVSVWKKSTDEIAEAAFKGLAKSTEKKFGKQSINPVYIMMDSGARGNRQQVSQLCGARGLMAKPNGEILETPILSSFREGLTVLEYFISTHGARKGLADTALKTADAGYLTRKLCDVAMDVVIGNEDDGNRAGIKKTAIYEGSTEIPLKDRIWGRYSSEDILNPINPSEIVVGNGELITEEIADKIQSLGIDSVRVMSPLTHLSKNTLCAKAYGINPATTRIVDRGTAVGIIAAQSIGEPGTQLTMRTFHIGGIANIKNPEIKAKNKGKIHFVGARMVSIEGGYNIVLNKTGKVEILDLDDEKVLEDYNLVAGTLTPFSEGDTLDVGDLIAQWDVNSVPIISEKSGQAKFKDMIEGVTVKKKVDSATGNIITTIIDHKDDFNPTVNIISKQTKEVVAFYPIPVGAQISIHDNAKVDAGAILAKTPRQAAKTQDITGGLPRVAELFEARKPKDCAEMAKIDGIVSMEGTIRGKKKLVVMGKDGESEEHLIPHGKHIIVHPKEEVKKGDRLTEGGLDPSEILDILGEEAVQEYLLSEIQKLYRSQSVTINDKHIEVIISRMLRKVRITDPGDTEYFWGEQVDKYQVMEENQMIIENGGKPAESEPILLGITKASLETESFISAASFQETTRVLTEASTLGKKDSLSGFKENVIMGHLIPAGTGLPKYRRIRVRPVEGAEAAIDMENLEVEDIEEDLDLQSAPQASDFQE